MVMRFARSWLRWRPIGLTSASVAAVAVTAVRIWPADVQDPDRTAIVTEAPFRDALVEQGTVSSARLMLYGSTIAGAQAKILDLVPEGAAVAPGEPLVRFDPAPFEDAAAREAAGVSQAEAEVLRATEDLRQEQLRADTEREAAKADVSEAEAALANERDGKGPLALEEAEAAARDAARELTRARAADADMEALLQRGFVTRVEADRADLALRQAEDHDRVATLALQTLRRFGEPAALEKSKADVSAAGRTLTGATAAAASRLVQRQAALTLAQSRLAESRARLAHARDDVARTVVRSETSGLVVYRELYFGTEKRKPEPGDEVWPNQPIVAVPDPDALTVDTRVRELDLHQVTPGARVTVTIDAYPGLRLAASVRLVGALAQEDATRAGTRFFPLTVALTDGDARLRTGMTARVEIEVTRLDRAIVVPVQAIVESPDGRTSCRVLWAGRVTTRPVDVTARNHLVAAIGRGLSAGEVVLLVDPARASGTPRDRP